LKKILGKAAYLVTALTRFTSIRAAQGRMSGLSFAWAGAFLILAVGNGRQAGGGFPLCPEALLNDGMFDVRILPQVGTEEIPRALGVLFREGLAAAHQTTVSARLAQLQVEAEEPIQINLDGEPITDTRFQFDLLPHRLPMKLPPGCPLLA
jgi:diacylglycerol kinase family enzyme